MAAGPGEELRCATLCSAACCVVQAGPLVWNSSLGMMMVFISGKLFGRVEM